MNWAMEGMESFAVPIDSSKHCMSVLNSNKLLLMNPNLCHKIVIWNTYNNERNVILKIIMDAVAPRDLIPVSYTTDGVSSSFTIQNCAAAIQDLCSKNLFVANPTDPSYPFQLGIILGYSQTQSNVRLEMQDNIQTVINKRYNPVDSSLNLDCFHADPDLIEYIPLSQKRLLFFILSLCKYKSILHIKLSNNDITSLPHLCFSAFRYGLMSLDLRNNLISSMPDLEAAFISSITELHLDGNPLCRNYDEVEYVKVMKAKFTKLEKLDGCPIISSGFLLFRRNYVCDVAGQGLVDKFLEHFFTIYDGDRSLLENLYHPEAYFSVTSQYMSGQISSKSAELLHYNRISRNLKMLSDLSKGGGNLWCGNRCITRILESLPKTEHDPYSFTADLVYNSDTTAIVVITGIFRESSEKLNTTDRHLSFTRTFALMATEHPNEYKIINDQFHVNNALTSQELRSFKVKRPWQRRCVEVPPAKNIREENELVEAVHQITSLNYEWSRKCLTDSNYNLTNALLNFVDLFKVDKVPMEAFIVPEEQITVKVIPQSKNSPSIQNRQPTKSNLSQSPDRAVTETKKPKLNDNLNTSARNTANTNIRDTANKNTRTNVNKNTRGNANINITEMSNTSNRSAINTNSKSTIAANDNTGNSNRTENTNDNRPDTFSNTPENIKCDDKSNTTNKDSLGKNNAEQMVICVSDDENAGNSTGQPQATNAPLKFSMEQHLREIRGLMHKKPITVEDERAMLSKIEEIVAHGKPKVNQYDDIIQACKLYKFDNMIKVFTDMKNTKKAIWEEGRQSVKKMGELIQHIDKASKTELEANKFQFAQALKVVLANIQTIELNVDDWIVICTGPLKYNMFNRFKKLVNEGANNLEPEDVCKFFYETVQLIMKQNDVKSRSFAIHLIERSTNISEAEASQYYEYVNFVKTYKTTLARTIFLKTVENEDRNGTDPNRLFEILDDFKVFEETYGNEQKKQECLLLAENLSKKKFSKSDSLCEPHFLMVGGKLRRSTTVRDLKKFIWQLCPDLVFSVERKIQKTFTYAVFRIGVSNKDAVRTLLNSRCPPFMKIWEYKPNKMDKFVNA